LSEFNVVIATPTSGQVKMAYASSLAGLCVNYVSTPIFEGNTHQGLSLAVMVGSCISANRDDLVNNALKKPEVTHILFIDDDMGFPQDTLHIMARRKLPIVSCNYRMRVPPARFTAVGLDGHPVILDASKTGVEEVAYTGFGFCLIAREVLEAVAEPRFMLEFNPDTKYSTEDSTFFRKAREKGYKNMVDHDASKGLLHVGELNYTWRDDLSKIEKDFYI
jgi:hypothetical protein